VNTRPIRSRIDERRSILMHHVDMLLERGERGERIEPTQLDFLLSEMEFCVDLMRTLLLMHTRDDLERQQAALQ
jgi:hypothetical protein